MIFAPRAPSSDMTIDERVSNNGRVVTTILNYLCGQKRVQVWFDSTGASPAEQTDILLEM
jgi:hypothetical protein